MHEGREPGLLQSKMIQQRNVARHRTSNGERVGRYFLPRSIVGLLTAAGKRKLPVMRSLFLLGFTIGTVVSGCAQLFGLDEVVAVTEMRDAGTSADAAPLPPLPVFVDALDAATVDAVDAPPQVPAIDASITPLPAKM